MPDLSTCRTCGSAVEEPLHHAMYCGLNDRQSRAADRAYCELRRISRNNAWSTEPYGPVLCAAIGTEPVTVHGLGANGIESSC